MQNSTASMVVLSGLTFLNAALLLWTAEDTAVTAPTSNRTSAPTAAQLIPRVLAKGEVPSAVLVCSTPEGVEVRGLGPRDPLYRQGLREHDVLQSIDGISVADLDRLLRAQQRLSTAETVEVTVRRADTIVALTMSDPGPDQMPATEAP